MFFLAIFFMGTAFLPGEEILWQIEKPEGFSIKVYSPSGGTSLGVPFAVTIEIQYPQDYELDAKLMRANLMKQLRPGSAPFQVVDWTENTAAPTETGSPFKNKKTTFWLEPQILGKQFFSFWNIDFEPVDPKYKKMTIVSPIFQLNIEQAAPEIEMELMIPPFLTIRESLPIDLSPENKRAFLQNPALEEEEASRNVRLLKDKKFPWVPLFAFLAAGFLILTSRRIKATSRLKIKNSKEEALSQLKNLEKLLPDLNAEGIYTELIKIVRNFLAEAYQVPIDRQTTEEFLKNISKTHLFDKRKESALSIFLEYADTIRFGKQPTTYEECKKALRLVADFIKSS